ncbi:MAG: cell division protein FtsZ [Deltaproteobacteria bacterium]|nr:MAG: cell division protein FtsZ [Deltaproteobacteria bacterium]
MTFPSNTENDNSAKLKIIGVGGGGGNAVNNMIESNLEGVKFIVANTDAQDLQKSKSSVKLQIGTTTTQGLGAGADPQKGRQSALESSEAIKDALKDAHMVFIATGLGGGTGTGAAPVVAKICKEMDILTVAVVTKPFSFEGKKRRIQAEEGLEELRNIVDTVISIPNDKLLSFAPKNASVVDMFKKADEILHHSVKGISDLIFKPGLVNLDFADVKTIMSEAGIALMGIGVSSGENKAAEAAEKAISHPLLDDISIKGARGVLVNIASSNNLQLNELNEAMDKIFSEAGDDVNLIWGQAIDENLEDEIQITVIATGIDSNKRQNSFDEDPYIKRSGSASSSTPTRGRVRPATATDISDIRLITPSDNIHSGGIPPQHNQQIRSTSRVEGQENLYNGTLNRFSDSFDTPAIWRKKKKSKFMNLDLPTFLRKEAD